ncbi:hypothetical protein, partial [Larkinella ripae]
MAECSAILLLEGDQKRVREGPLRGGFYGPVFGVAQFFVGPVKDLAAVYIVNLKWTDAGEKRRDTLS